jgi:catechol 2,3-dioxygenase-like lactoylglutathione lyase family enzyme
MARPALDGVVETCLYVEDVERSRDFYAQIFGFTPLGGNERIQPLEIGRAHV